MEPTAGGRGTKIVREIATERWTASTRATQDAGAELGRVLSAAAGETTWAQLLSARVLAADDRRGRDLGLVVQHDELRWADLLSVLDEVAPRLAAMGHPLPGCAGTRCSVCQASRALLRVQRIWEEKGLTGAGDSGADHGTDNPPMRTG